MITETVKDPREGFAEGLYEIAGKNKDVLFVSPDSALAMRISKFSEKYPDRIVETGIAEQNAAMIGAGLAAAGKIPFVGTFAVFTGMRICEQLRTFIAYPGLNVKIVGALGGIHAGQQEGPTHQGMEDIGIVRCIPNITLIAAADAVAAKKMTIWAAQHNGPVYIRLGWGKIPVIYSEDYDFKIGKANVLIDDGDDLAIIATGIMVLKALEAREILLKEGIRVKVADMHTIKPIDKETILDLAGKTGAILTAEDHTIVGGLGSAVSEVLSEEQPTLMKRIGIRDTFTESGKGEDLLNKYGMGTKDIVRYTKELIEKKKRGVLGYDKS
jgi:transketolase